MVLSFFRKGPGGLEHAVSRAVGMLGDARHSFDLATLALLTETGASAVDADIRATDEKMNRTEIELRSELVIHISVQGTMDIGAVLGLILLINRIERIGDQAKNVLDLAEAGAVLADQPDSETLLAERAEISALFGEVGALMLEHDDARFAELTRRCEELHGLHQAKILGYVHSSEPGHQVVPRAIYYRYLNRIVANLLGIARAASEPVVLAPNPSVTDLDEQSHGVPNGRTAPVAVVSPDCRYTSEVWTLGEAHIDGFGHIPFLSKEVWLDDDAPPFSFVKIDGTVTLHDDLDEVRRFATVIGGRYMGADRADEFGRRNGVPGELLVRLHPTKVTAKFDVAD